MAFESNVFINCPFDDGYYGILRPILFTTIYLGLKPRISLERSDSGESRIAKILELIRESKYAIHDLSRIKAKKAGDIFRLNMPFELGLDVGCRNFGGGVFSQKRCLILEAERYRYQAALSDLSGSDIAAHGNEPKQAATAVRNWLASQCCPDAAGPTKIWAAFNDFMAVNYDDLKARGYGDTDISSLPMSELIVCMQNWMVAKV
jgi:hypothetical protein